MIFHHVAGLVIFLTIVNTKKRFPVISNEPELVSKGFGYSFRPFYSSSSIQKVASQVGVFATFSVRFDHLSSQNSKMSFDRDTQKFAYILHLQAL